MGFFNSIRNMSEMAAQQSAMSKTNKEIYNMRDNLRNTPQFSNIFYALISDINHPPRKIEATQSGDFWSEAWQSAFNNYEPYSTHKFSDVNIGYREGCAIYLLIQECYPSVYDFPGNTLAQIQNGATIKLIMKKQFIGKPLKPAVIPPAFSAAPQENTAPEVTVEVPSSTAETNAPSFCSGCGSKLGANVAFCPACGKKVN